MIIVNSKDLFGKKELEKTAGMLIALNKNIIIFGLPYSGKSTLVKAVCKTDKNFKTIPEEELLSDQDIKTVLKKSTDFWCVSHQYPSQKQDVSEHYLNKFAEKMDLDLKKWRIVKILK